MPLSSDIRCANATEKSKFFARISRDASLTPALRSHPMADASPDPFLAALERIADGSPLRKACAEVGIRKQALLKRAEEDPSFAARYARAREHQAEHHADELLEAIRVLDAMTHDKDVTSAQVMAARTALDQRRWVMARMKPRVYGERIEHEVRGAIAHVTRVELSPTLAGELRLLGERYALGLLDAPKALASGGAEEGADPPTGGE
jgi:hypothetical protein